MPQPTQTSSYLDPVALARLKNFGLAARLVVEGLFSGQHRSPRKGFSVEFAEHRQYTPGVDLRHLDWKLLARSDRLYVKQYEEQTNLRATIVLDASASMGYRHEGPMSKLEYACYVAASLAHLMMVQQDAFGLIVCGQGVRDAIPPRQGRGHLSGVLEALEAIEPAGETRLAETFEELAPRMKRRGLVIVISDMLGEPGGAAAILNALGHFRHRKHELIALQVLDPAELTFPFRDAGRIVDMESGGAVQADAEAIRTHYLEQLNDYLGELKRGCISRRIDYALTDTVQSFDGFLTRFLTQRGRD